MTKKELIAKNFLPNDFKAIRKTELHTVNVNEWLRNKKRTRPDVKYFVVLPEDVTLSNIRKAFTNADNSRLIIFTDNTKLVYLKGGLEYAQYSLDDDQGLLDTFSDVVPTTEELKEVGKNFIKPKENKNMSSILTGDINVDIFLLTDKVLHKEALTAEEKKVLVDNFDMAKDELGIGTLEELEAMIQVEDGAAKSTTAGSNVKTSSAFENANTGNTGDEEAKPDKKPGRSRTKVKSVIGEENFDKIKKSRQAAISEAKQNFFEFNRKLGRFINFVVRDDAKLTVTTSSFYPQKDGKFMFKPDVSEEVKKVALGDGKPTDTVSKSQLKKANLYVQMLRIGVKQAAPQKIIGAFYSIPSVSLLNFDKLDNDADLQAINYENQALDYVHCIYQDLSAHLKSFFDGEIIETEALAVPYYKRGGDVVPATADFRLKVKTSQSLRYSPEDIDKNGKVKEGATAVGFDVDVKIVSNERRSLLTPKNYIALNRFVTIDALSATEEELAEMNEWYLRGIFKNGRNKSTSKYDSLAGEYAAWISKGPKNEAGVEPITSFLFTSNNSESVLGKAVKAMDWYSGKEEVAYQFPKKEQKDKRTVFVKESLLEEDSNYTLDAYPEIKAILGDNLTVDVLKEMNDLYTKTAAEDRNIDSDPMSAEGSEAVRLLDTVDDMKNIRIKNLQANTAVQERIRKSLAK